MAGFITWFVDARYALADLFFGLYACRTHGVLQNTKDHSPVSGCQRAGSTTPTLLTPLHAIYTRPSEVAAIFRIVPPPEGMFARAKLSVFGSNRTIVFGFTPDSLYQTIPSGVIAMPYGADFAPPGDCHIFTAPEVMSRRPRWPSL